MDVSNGAGCDRGIRFDACSDLDVGGEEIFFSCCLFSAMAPERVLPSPPSDGGLLRGEEVVRDEILEVVAKGGIARRRRYCSSSWVGLARVGRRVLVLRGLGARALSRACFTLDVRDGGGCCSAPPSRPEERLVSRRSSSPRKMFIITVKLLTV